MVHAVRPVDLRATLVERVHGFVYQRRRQVRLRVDVVRAEDDAAVVLVASRKLRVALAAVDFRGGEGAAAAREVFQHEFHAGVAGRWRLDLHGNACRDDGKRKGEDAYLERACSLNFSQRAVAFSAAVAISIDSGGGLARRTLAVDVL